MGPPGEGVGFFWKGSAERIDVAGFLEIIKTFAFFFGETVFADVWFWVSQVDFIMGNIKVATK